LCAADKKVGAHLQECTIMLAVLSELVRDESGATAIEYGLIAALIAVVIITAITSVGTSLSSVFSSVAASL
jgi:pilus assembly protein Flp/PilA